MGRCKDNGELGFLRKCAEQEASNALIYPENRVKTHYNRQCLSTYTTSRAFQRQCVHVNPAAVAFCRYSSKVVACPPRLFALALRSKSLSMGSSPRLRSSHSSSCLAIRALNLVLPSRVKYSAGEFRFATSSVTAMCLMSEPGASNMLSPSSLSSTVRRPLAPVPIAKAVSAIA
jgi:hypothetical protein